MEVINLHLSDGLVPLWQAAHWILTIAMLALYMYKLSKTEDKENYCLRLFSCSDYCCIVNINTITIWGSHTLFIIPLVVILLDPLGVIVAFLCFVVQFLPRECGITSLGANVVTMGLVMSFSNLLLLQIHCRT